MTSLNSSEAKNLTIYQKKYEKMIDYILIYLKIIFRL